MIHSMTGYGRASAERNGKKVTVEIRSLNAKNLDLTLRLPSLIREKDPDIRSMVRNAVQRGKVELSAHLEGGATNGSLINRELAQSYFDQLAAMSKDWDVAQGDILSTIVRMPDVLQSTTAELTEEEWEFYKEVVQEALDNFNSFRAREGEAIEKDFQERLSGIRSAFDQVTPYEEERMAKVKDRLNQAFQKSGMGEGVDRERFEQELIYYLEKLDINEEKTRLTEHMDYFSKQLGADPGQGRKLGFIAQEMGREINTLGSKANHAEIQRLVVKMKDELEKIKEQVLNSL